LQFAGTGADNHLPEGNNWQLCRCEAQQRARCQEGAVCAWKRSKQYDEAHASHAGSWAGGWRMSEVPALRLGNQKIAKYLDAGNRFQFLRIDEIGVKGDGI
jgi:hypothetical protein